MKKVNIELTLQEAQKLYAKADPVFKEFLESNFKKEYLQLDICDRIKNLEDVFSYLGETLEDYLLFDLDTKNSRERYLNACSLIPKIVQAYNENYKLDWTNSSEYKYLPYYKLVGSGWVADDCRFWGSVSGGSACQHYKSSKLVLQATKTFNQIYIDYYSFTS